MQPSSNKFLPAMRTTFFSSVYVALYWNPLHKIIEPASLPPRLGSSRHFSCIVFFGGGTEVCGVLAFALWSRTATQ